MAKKKTQLDLVIEAMRKERADLITVHTAQIGAIDSTIATLLAQQAKAPKRQRPILTEEVQPASHQ